jgi:hypothetical protein
MSKKGKEKEADVASSGNKGDEQPSGSGVTTVGDGASGITEDTAASETGIVGGGDSSPADIAHGFQPVPGLRAEEQLKFPEPGPEKGSGEVPEGYDKKFGDAEAFKDKALGDRRSVSLPGVRHEDVKDVIKDNPQITHQGQPGSGVAPGAALPGESIQQREARRASRVQSSEIKRAIENGTFGTLARVVNNDEGFDLVLGLGTDSEVRFSELLNDGQAVQIDLSLKNGF